MWKKSKENFSWLAYLILYQNNPMVLAAQFHPQIGIEKSHHLML